MSHVPSGSNWYLKYHVFLLSSIVVKVSRYTFDAVIVMTYRHTPPAYVWWVCADLPGRRRLYIRHTNTEVYEIIILRTCCPCDLIQDGSTPSPLLFRGSWLRRWTSSSCSVWRPPLCCGSCIWVVWSKWNYATVHEYMIRHEKQRWGAALRHRW